MNNKIVKNASWIIICRVFQSVLNIFVSMFMARYLGPSNYGTVSYAASLVAFIVPIVQLGLNNVIVHELIESPEKEGETMGTVVGVCLLSSFLGVIAIGAITSIINHGETETIQVCILYSLSLIFQMTEMIHYWYQAKLMSKYVALTSLFSRVIVSIYKVFLIVTRKNILWFAIVHGLDYFIISLILFYIYRKIGKQRLSFSMQTAGMLLKKGKHFIIPGIMVSVFSQTDKIMLKLMINDAESGIYAAASTCAVMTVFVFSAIIESYRPVIFLNKKENRDTYENSIVNLYSVILYLALIQSIVLTFGAKIVIYILYGAEFMSAAAVLRIITWHSACSYIGSANHIWMLAEGKQKYLWMINVSGAVVNVIGNLVLIPFYGACGAAIASVVTQFVINYGLYFIFKPIKENGRFLLRATDPRVLWAIIRSFQRRLTK